MEQGVLTKEQKVFLASVTANTDFSKQFYFTGGTALTEYYLHHRESDDLDFFSEQEFSIEPLTVFIVQLKSSLNFEEFDYQKSFNRNLFFLHFARNYVLKAEFTYFPFPLIEKRSEDNLQIDSLIDIAVNKLFTIYQNPRSRDYIDLYFILEQEKWDISDLLAKAKIKFDWHIDPLQLGSQFIRVKELITIDYPKMLKEIDDKEMEKFFFQEAKKLRGQVLS